MSKIFIVVPAYNEEVGIQEVVPDISKVLNELEREHLFIIVNDGSTDRTQEVSEELAKTYPIEIIRHDPNQNVGAVFRNGLTRASELSTSPNDVLITSEGDNTCSPEIYEKMIALIDEGKDAVAATRYEKGSVVEGFSFMRQTYSKGINTILRTFYPIKGITDYSIFIRAYRAELIKASIEFYGQDWIESVGFVANAEMMIKARVFKPQCASVPMYYRYGVKDGGTKIKVSKTIMEYFKFFARLRKCQKKYASKELPEFEGAESTV